MIKLKLDAMQTVALHIVESAGLSALVTVVSALVQYISTHGLNFGQLGIVAGGAFLGALAMMYKSLSSNPQVIAGLNDTIPQIWTSVQNIESALIPGVTPRPTSISTKATQSTWKPTVNGPTTPDHAG